MKTLTITEDKRRSWLNNRNLKSEELTTEDYYDFQMDEEENMREYVMHLEQKFFRFPEEW